MIRHRCVVAVVLSLGLAIGGTFAQDVPSIEDWRGLNITRRDQQAQQAFVREKFPLSNDRIRQFLGQSVAEPKDGNEQNYLATILYSHGAQGFLWGLSRLGENDSIWVRRNMMWCLHFHRYREVHILLIGLLNDKREIPEVPHILMGEVSRPVRPGCGLVRICDTAFNYICGLLHEEGLLPSELKGKSVATRSDTLRDRDEGIAILQAWWKKHGQRLITETKPSVVDGLLKESQKKDSPAVPPDKKDK